MIKDKNGTILRDALGNPIILGNIYGYAISQKGTIYTTIGRAVKGKNNAVTINILRKRKAVRRESHEEDLDFFKSTFMKAICVFPIQEYQEPQIEIQTIQNCQYEIQCWKNDEEKYHRINGPAKIFIKQEYKTPYETKYETPIMEWWINGQFIGDNKIIKDNKHQEVCKVRTVHTVRKGRKGTLPEKEQIEYDNKTIEYLNL